jgi:hypothetical protein
MDKYKETANDRNYDTSCSLTSLSSSDFEHFTPLIFVVQSVQNASIYYFEYLIMALKCYMQHHLQADF